MEFSLLLLVTTPAIQRLVCVPSEKSWVWQGVIRVHVPFAVSDLVQSKQKLRLFSEDTWKIHRQISGFTYNL